MQRLVSSRVKDDFVTFGQTVMVQQEAPDTVRLVALDDEGVYIWDVPFGAIDASSRVQHRGYSKCLHSDLEGLSVLFGDPRFVVASEIDGYSEALGLRTNALNRWVKDVFS